MLARLKNRSKNDIIRLVTSALLILSVTVFFIIDSVSIKGLEGLTKPDRAYLTFILLLAAALVNLIPVFFKKASLVVLAAILLLSFGIGIHLYLVSFAIADIGTGVPFFTNSIQSATLITKVYGIFLALFLLCEVACIVSAFKED